MVENKSSKTLFHTSNEYRNPSYQLLPFSFTRHSSDKFILSNDYGEYQFINANSLSKLTNKAALEDNLYHDLKSKFFIADEVNEQLLNLLGTKLRTKKSFLYNFTSLHMFVVTLRCDHSCAYCQVSRQNIENSKYDMSSETADKAVDLVFQSASPSIKIEFQGGESLLNFKLIKHIVLRALEINQTLKKDLQFIIATNLSVITDEQIEFCKIFNIYISTSLDGPVDLHNHNRPLPSKDSHQRFIRNLEKVRVKLGHDAVSALMTTTTKSFEKPKEIVDEYLRLGFRNIFLRSISPYGFATKSKSLSEYDAEHFLKFYKTAFEYILEINRSGTTFVETFAEIILRKILTPFPTYFVDLQSPAGVGVGGVIYNYDGEVYLADEARMLAEMGDTHFSIGNVHKNTYNDIFSNPTLVEALSASVAETLPMCSDCAYRPFCGGDPIYHYATQGDSIGHRPTSFFCKKNMGVIRYLMNLIESADEDLMAIFYAWINRLNVNQLKDLKGS